MKVFYHFGDNIEKLKQYPDNSVDSIVTDAPYGLGKEPDVLLMLQNWIEQGYHSDNSKGFMNKAWDVIPQPIFWKEAFRVLKHGGHVLCFYGTRTYDLGVMAMRLAGFEIRDRIQFCFDNSSLRDEFIESLTDEQRNILGEVLKSGDSECFFAHGVGFPKGQDIGKMIDSRLGAEREKIENPLAKQQTGQDAGKGLVGAKNSLEYIQPYAVTEEAKKWSGWNTQLKPSNEPIVLARKPLQQGMTIAENVLEHGTGGINIDATRIGETGARFNGRNVDSDIFGKYGVDKPKEDYNKGRFPANIVLQHSDGCECIGTKKVKGSNCKPSDIGKGREGTFTHGILGETKSKVSVSHTDEEGFEEVEEWKCVSNCPIRILDEQSGVSRNRPTRIVRLRKSMD